MRGVAINHLLTMSAAMDEQKQVPSLEDFLPTDQDVWNKPLGTKPGGWEGTIVNFNELRALVVAILRHPHVINWNKQRLTPDELKGLTSDPPVFPDEPIFLLDTLDLSSAGFNQITIESTGRFRLYYGGGNRSVVRLILRWYLHFYYEDKSPWYEGANDWTMTASHLHNNLGTLGKNNINPRHVVLEPIGENQKRELCGANYLSRFKALQADNLVGGQYQMNVFGY